MDRKKFWDEVTLERRTVSVIGEANDTPAQLEGNSEEAITYIYGTAQRRPIGRL